MINPLKLFRRTIFLVWLCFGLVSGATALAAWAFTLSTQVATLTANAASAAIRHRKQITKSVAKAKAKGRVRRVLVAVPAVGTVAAFAFEAQDYYAWEAENPDGTAADYACEVAELSAEVVDEVLQELPEMTRPSPDAVLAMMPTCDVIEKR